MTRRPKVLTLFGSFDELLNSGRYTSREDWWIFLASGVALEGDGRVSHDLQALLPAERVDVAWFRDVAPVGLAFPRRPKVDGSPLSLGCVAGKGKTPTTEEVAYPFIVRESEDRMLIEFSANGPAPELQRSIVVALGDLLLWR